MKQIKSKLKHKHKSQPVMYTSTSTALKLEPPQNCIIPINFEKYNQKLLSYKGLISTQ